MKTKWRKKGNSVFFSSNHDTHEKVFWILMILFLAIMLSILFLPNTVFGGDKSNGGPTLKNCKSFVVQSLIADLEDQSIHLSNFEDITSLAKNYELLGKACEEIKLTQVNLAKLYRDLDFAICEHVILGAGDTGTTVWLEKYKPHHGKIHEKLKLGQLPDVLMIGETFGSWWHDYTLAQPYSLIDRCIAPSNPSDYLFQSYFHKNPYANARHVYQANLVNLAKTEAPNLIGIKVLRIEKKSEHPKDWKSQNHKYRLITVIPAEEKVIYANEVDVCTGLGPAREAIADKCSSMMEFDRLTQFDIEKGFTPIIDGDQFIFSNSEEKSPNSRTIIIYGGGGTASACYRKAFFGHDRKKEPISFENHINKNKVMWIAKNGFDAAGGGRLATKALETAKKRNELFIGEISEITLCASGERLKICFKLLKEAEDGSAVSISEIECDQLVYAIGQDAAHLKEACEEFNTDLQLEINPNGIPLCVKTNDDKIHFFGAAAMSIRPNDYMANTWNWLHEENIGPDVGPGSMPPSRAQIKEYLFEKGIPIDWVNVNIDSIHLIEKFLYQSGIQVDTVSHFIADVLQARKDSTAGFTTSKLEGFLTKYQMNENVSIQGHSNLYRKSKKLMNP